MSSVPFHTFPLPACPLPRPPPPPGQAPRPAAFHRSPPSLCDSLGTNNSLIATCCNWQVISSLWSKLQMSQPRASTRPRWTELLPPAPSRTSPWTRPRTPFAAGPRTWSWCCGRTRWGTWPTACRSLLPKAAKSPSSARRSPRYRPCSQPKDYVLEAW